MKIMLRAYLDNNLGDDLMIKLLLDKFPNHDFLLYSSSSTVLNTYKEYSNVEIKTEGEMKKDLKNIDVFITIGGSIFQIETFKQHLTRFFKIVFLKLLKIRKVKIVTLGANLGPFANKISYKLVELELRQNDLTTVRDLSSMKIVQSFRGVKNYHLSKDIVYYLKKSIQKEKKGLGISTYRSTKTKENNFQNYSILSKIVDNYIDRTGEVVKLFAFDSETENDLVSAHHIFNISRNKSKITIIPYLGNSEYFLEEFSSCKSIIAIRFHSAILSDIYGIPFLPIIYSNKMRNLLNDNDYEGISIPILSLNEDIDTNALVESLITEKNIFHNFIDQRDYKLIHFEELSKILLD